MKHPDKLAMFTYLSYFYDIFHDKDPVSFHGNPPDSPPPVHIVPSSPPSRSWNTKMTLARPVTTDVTKETDVRIRRSVTPRAASPRPTSVFGGAPVNASDKCYFCQKTVYLMERQSAQGVFFHRSCFRCYHCNSQLKTGNYSYSHGSDGEKGRFYCTPHFKQLFLSNPEAINYGRHRDGPTMAKKTSQPSPLMNHHDNVRQDKYDERRQDHTTQQQRVVADKRTTQPLVVTKPTSKGPSKVLDRIKGWETGNVAPVDTTPPSIHDNNRIAEPPPEDSGHDNRPQEVTKRRVIYSYEDTAGNQDDTSKQNDSNQDTSKQNDSNQGNSKQDTSNQDNSKQDDVSKQDDISKQDDVEVFHEDNKSVSHRYDNHDEMNEDDVIAALPDPVTTQPIHSSTPQPIKQQNSEAENDAEHRRSGRVISRQRLQLSKRHQTTMELSSNEDVSSKRATRMTRMRSIGAPTRGQRRNYRRAASRDDIQLTDNKLQEHRKHYSRLLKVCLSICVV